MQPMNYNIDVKSPMDQAVSGFQTGLGMREAQTKIKADEAALALKQQLQTDLGVLATNKNAGAGDYSAMMVKYPQLSEHFKRSWDVLNADQQKERLALGTQAYAAISAGKPEVAVDLLRERATALRNSGNEAEAKQQEALAKTIELNPASAKTTAGLMLSSIMGPEKFAETFSKLGEEGRKAEQGPADLRKRVADADLAEIKARYGEKSEIADLAVKGWNIKKIEADIADNKVKNQLKNMELALSRETNGLKRQELQMKVDEKRTELLDKARGKIAEVESARFNIDNMMNTLTRLKDHPGLEGATGSIAGRLPSLMQDSADFDALIENVDAQAFLSQIPQMKGMGALSDAEGKKLTAALQSFSTKQSPTQLKTNLTEATRLMQKARTAMTVKYGIPDTVPDTPAALPDAKTTDDLLKKYLPHQPKK